MRALGSEDMISPDRQEGLPTSCTTASSKACGPGFILKTVAVCGEAIASSGSGLLSTLPAHTSQEQQPHRTK